MRKPGKPGDRREMPPNRPSVSRVTAKPKSAKPEQKEPKRPPNIKSILGQSGKRKGAK